MDLKKIKKDISKHSPELLLGIGIAGMASSVVMAVKATPKALAIIEDEENNQNRDLKNIEKMKVAWKPYIPAAISFGVSTACLLGSNSAHAKRNAILASAYHISERALTEYRDKVVEVVGEEAERGIRDAVSRDRMKTDPVSNQEVVLTGKGEVLCYDSISGRYFKSDMNELQKAENVFNKNLLSENYCPLNDFYDELGLDPIEVGDYVGWNINDGLMELYFTTQFADNGEPCLVVNYITEPKHGYDKM